MAAFKPMEGHTPATVHVWLSGQADNVGDSMLRRVYAEKLRAMGRLSVWAGDPDSGYAAGLRLLPGEAARGYFRWCLNLTRSAFAGENTFAFNAGEFVPTRRYVAGIVSLLPIIFILKMRRGRVVWLGAGVRRTRCGFTWPFVKLAKWSDLLLWREARSAELIGSGGTMPDWAFGSGRDDAGERAAANGQATETGADAQPPRELLAISLRGDRPEPSERWVRAVLDASERLRLRPIVVVQVARDGASAQTLASRLGAELLTWTTDDHWQQEQLARGVYRRSQVVLSDRLHALVMGTTEDAVPLGWCETAGDKIARHFDLVGAEWVGQKSDQPADLLDALQPAQLDALVEAAKEVLAGARSELSDVGRRMARLAAEAK